VREIVGKTLANKVMFLQGPEGVLKDGVVRARLQRLPELEDIVRLLPSDSQKVFRRVEVKRLIRFAHGMLVCHICCL
jgi:hypothetical protein